MALGIVKGLCGTDSTPPVGFVWKSASSTSPASIYAGTTWSVIKDRAIIGAGSSYANGGTGGRTSVSIGTNEMPSHNHSGSTSTDGAHTHTGSVAILATPSYNEVSLVWGSVYLGNTTVTTSSAGGHSHSVSLNNVGSGNSFSILNTYIARYMWERIG